MEKEYFTCWLCGEQKPKPSHNGLPLVQGIVCDKCNLEVTASRIKITKAN